MANPEVPDFNGVAARKLADLLEKGFVITGYCFERQVEGTQPQRGFVDFAGFVGWWKSVAKACSKLTQEPCEMLSDEQIDMIRCHSRIPQATDREYLQLTRADMRVFARAIEAEVRKDDESLIRQMLEHLEVVTDAGPDGEGWQSQDLKNTITAARARLEKAP